MKPKPQTGEKTMHNIEKSGFHRGQYVGYGGGKVWHITRSTSSYGTWCARATGEANNYFFAFRLADISKKLNALAIA
jgi:hypothetical protein